MTCQVSDHNAIFLPDFCTQITFAAIRINLFGASYTNMRSAYVVTSVQFSDSGAHEDFKPHESGNRIPWKTDKRDVPIIAECQWFSGSHVDAPEIHFAVCFDHFLHKVKRADTYARRREDHIYFEVSSFFEQCLYRVVVIFCNAKPNYLCSCILDQCGDSVRVRI